MLNEGRWRLVQAVITSRNSPKLQSFVHESDWKENFDISQNTFSIYKKKPQTASAAEHGLRNCLAIPHIRNQ